VRDVARPLRARNAISIECAQGLPVDIACPVCARTKAKVEQHETETDLHSGREVRDDMIRISIGLAILVSTLGAAAAPPPPTEPESPPNGSENLQESAATTAVSEGSLSAFSVSPSLPRTAAAVALTGYDSAARGLRARGAADGRLLGFLAARIEYEHGPANGPSDRVSLGLRGAFLNQAHHGIELGAMAFYQPRDFRDEGNIDEGNIVAGLLLARRFARLTLVLNPLAGSDPEGDDQALELRFAGLYETNPWLVLGVDSHGRYNLSNDQKRAGKWGLDWEAQGGATAALCTGHFLFSALVGPSFLQRTYPGVDGAKSERELRAGLLAMAGAGGTF
jgi:hypothetical protein